MINKVTLVGRVGDKPEIFEVKNGQGANIRLATNRKYTKDGEKVEETEWHRITAFGKIVGVIEKYVDKGDLLYIEGRIRTRKYEDKEGVERKATDIMCENMQMLGSPKRKETSNSEEPDDEAPF